MKRILLASVGITILCRILSAQIIDYHQHLYSPEAGARSSPGPKGISASELIGYLDAAGIQRAVVLSVAYSFANPNKPAVPNEYELVKAENDWTSAQVAKYPERLTGFCGVNPLRVYAVAEIERCAKDRNLRTGLKLHFGNSDVDVTNPEHLAQMRRVFRAANQHHMAIAAHVRPTVDLNRPYGAKHARIMLEQLFPEAPDVTIQIAHLAGAGGYDSPSIDEAVAVFTEAIARKDPRMKNVYFDMTSVAGLGDWKNKAELIVRRMREIGMGRLLYGSDAAIPGNYPQEALARWRELPLTREEFRAVETNVAPYLR
jgi:predicted TIM-barrel fold metal-dependent hydrolase